jgi:hypothetical protein
MPDWVGLALIASAALLGVLILIVIGMVIYDHRKYR